MLSYGPIMMVPRGPYHWFRCGCRGETIDEVEPVAYEIRDRNLGLLSMRHKFMTTSNEMTQFDADKYIYNELIGIVAQYLPNELMLRYRDFDGAKAYEAAEHYVEHMRHSAAKNAYAWSRD